MATEIINYNDPAMIALQLLGTLNEISKQAKKLNLTGDVKCKFTGCSVDEWDDSFIMLREACAVNGYSMVNHIVEVEKAFNVYLLLD